MKKKITAALAALAMAVAMTLTLATPAQARTQYGGIPPQKSWVCSTFNICKTMTYCDTSGYKGHLFPRCYKWRY